MTLGKSLEDYLETILILKIKKGMVRSIDVADYMGFSKPRVSHAVNDNATQSARIMIIVLLVFIIKNLLLFVIKFYKLIVDCIFWTSFHTGTASYTFRMIWTLYNINIHFTYFCALMTSNAFIIFNLYAEK